ncbi:MAG: TonB-dependent receptor [Firmicutes bacterium]|nr:TonB-dependent receptor [Bacillota bacterium]
MKGSRGLGLVAVLASGLQAQVTGGLQIRAVDSSQRPVAGARLVLESLDRAERHTLRTNERGMASVAGLLPGSYRLQDQILQLRADERVQITVRLGAAQAVVGVEDRPLEAETSSLAPQMRLMLEDFQSLPFSPQRYVEHSYLAPGVGPSGKPEPVVLGSMLDSNAYLVDGLLTNLSTNGRFGLNLSTEILESQTLTTGGHKAEIAFAPGGVFSMVTRSGGNTFQGSLFGSRIWRGLNSHPDAGKTNFPDERPTDATAWGLSLSGPIVKDRLFFFAAFNRQLMSLDFDNVAPMGTLPHRRSQEEDRSYRFVKLTWMATEAHRVELSWFGDPVRQQHFDSAYDSSIKDFQMPDRTRGGNSFLLRHVGQMTETLTWENALGVHRTDFQWTPSNPEAGPNRAQLDAPGKESFGAYAEDRLDRIRNYTLTSELVWRRGDHTVKGGFQGLRAEYTVAYRRPSGGLSYVDRAAGGAGPASGDLSAIRAGLLALNGNDYGYATADSLSTLSPVSGMLVGGRLSYLYQRTLASLDSYGSPLIRTSQGLFLQDDWHLSPHWTFNLGLRADRVSLDGEDGRSLYRQTLTSPRAGLSWDPEGQGLTRLFAYWGRIYSPPAPGAVTSIGAVTGGPAQERQVWIPSLGQWKTWQSTGVQGVKNIAVAEDLRSPRTDLTQVGLERLEEIPGLGIWALSAVFTRKQTLDLIDTYNPAWGYLPELAAQANASAGKRVVANLPGLQRTFKGFDLSAQRRFTGGHSLQFSYSHGDLYGNSEVGGVASVTGKNTGFAQIPSLRDDYRLPRYTGLLNESLRHAFKAYGSAALPWNLELSGSALRRSGMHYSSLALRSGDLVLAPGAQRGDGELPWVTEVDLALSWTFRVQKVAWRVGMDVYNLTNAQPMIVINNLDGAFTAGNYQQPRVWQMSLRASF